jgi:5'-3' exonuclease
MILLDWSNVIIGNIMVSQRYDKSLDEGLIRHLVLNNLRSYRKRFKKKYGELVICTDFHSSWRKEVFPFYKASRKKAREKSTTDWSNLFEIVNKITDEIEENFPYKIIKIAHAEADDVIGTLTFNKYEKDKVLIISSDKDFVQLHQKNVDQFSPRLNKMLVEKDPNSYIKEHIIKGDVGDGIPNILSDDDCLINEEKRQKPLAKKKIAEWINKSVKEFNVSDDVINNYERNKKLIDLTNTPDELKSKIITMYQKQETPSGRGLLNYFMKNDLNNLMEVLNDFV